MVWWHVNLPTFCRRVSCNLYQHFRPTSRNFTFDKTSLDDSQLNVAMHTTDRYMHGHNPQLSSYYFLFGYSSLTPGKETFPKVSHHDCIAPTLHCIHRKKKNRTSRPNVCVDGSGIKVTGNRSSLYKTKQRCLMRMVGNVRQKKDTWTNGGSDVKTTKSPHWDTRWACQHQDSRAPLTLPNCALRPMLLAQP